MNTEPKNKEDILKEIPFEDTLRYYSAKFYCTNCKHWSFRYIRKGVMRPEVLRCDACECHTAH